MALLNKFAETLLKTKYGEFNLRVYLDSDGKENVVLWTKNLSRKKPVLVRVHSECLTGDLLGSLHCDCGQQLTKSLHLISEEGGILIYLRQEGRGIGLFEKIKSYNLQSKGYDTFEANVLLGHQPDQRSYEMVKTILQDLRITTIKLLTNNPSKISEISKYGIKITDRIPLLTKPNQYNRSYLETKRVKFQHIINELNKNYFYQVPVSDSKVVKTIIKFAREKNKDPLLKIKAAISANHSSLTDTGEINKTRSLLKACTNQTELIPVLHFSFLKTQNPLEDILEIKKTFPGLRNLQINDLEQLGIKFLKKAGQFFSLDIPISDQNFSLIHSSQFRDFVVKTDSFIVLDNSKGNGILEQKDSLIKKIDILLNYGINNITLSGGFGPDQLHTFFEIKRYYKINFSIDAESKLKTNKTIDIEKVKTFLFQLIRFDTPNFHGIKQTRDFLHSLDQSNQDKVTINNHEFLILPRVFHAGSFPSTAWFASELCNLLTNDSEFCEIGCGAGVISCLAALSNPNLRITATDIDPSAIENARLNAKNLNLLNRMTLLCGDVLDPVEPNVKFDSIFWALPFGYLDPGVTTSLQEAQVFDPGYKSIRKLLNTAKNYLKPKGKLYLGFSTDLGHFDLLKDLVKEVKASIKIVSSTEIQETEKLRFEILELSYRSMP